ARRCALGVTAWTRLRSHAFASRGDDRPAGAWFAVARRPRSIRSVSTLWVHWVGLVLSNGSRPDRWRVNRVRELRVPNRRPPRRRGFGVVVGATRTDARRAAVAIMTWNASSKLRTCWCPPNRWTALCVGLTLCASCAERTSSKPATQASPTLPDATAASTPYTYSPQRDDSPRPGAGPCPDSDGGLRRAAESVLDEYARTSRLPSSEALEFALRSAGV